MGARALAELVASWDGAVVPARVQPDGGGGWHKGSIRGWPARASSDPADWPEGWFEWGGNWHVALCPRHGGLVALDLDGPEAVSAFREAVRTAPTLWWRGVEPDTPTEAAHPRVPLAYTTPGHGGGMHVVWRWPRGLPAFSRLVVTLPGGGQVDLRGEGTFLLLYGAPRPDLPDGASYGLVSRPGEGGPPESPPGLVSWMETLGDVGREGAPSLQVRQMSPEQVAAAAAAQGGKIRTDRHTTLFAAASWLRVRQGTRTFEQLATALGQLVEKHFEVSDEEAHWAQEVIRVARNAAKYTQERDRRQEEAAIEALKALNLA